ncbi:acylneuraminate cytidylyltransferase [Hyphococcus flavus]|uniref:N-acylneuraminate cytidylyltransferase n=1 Tax=Hyphococcus flavus TaxID=1866326 RepID=A0AAE9ZH83_9PROT|nr:acylneuraminate cytidylyltransferase [Hyphococcus flavus]WDI32482.1 acylneuraminate cytidylyltransferase [Hyphococcus flavus]
MKVIAIIPARGGSKGIPGKNLQLITGDTLLGRTINSAKGATRLSDIYVSTDDPAIAAEARTAGAEVIDRPASLAGDTASSEAALLHALEEIEKNTPSPDILVFLQCTSPFTTGADIDGVINKLINEKADSALTVAPAHAFLWLENNATGEVEAFGHDKHHRPRRQDREPQYAETGAVYAMRVDGFKETKHRFFGKTVGFITDDVNLMEIDTPLELELCRLAVNFTSKAKLSEMLPKAIDAVLFDFDGVMTDDSVYVDDQGREMVRANRGDGLGIERLRATPVKIGVISKEKNLVVSKRCEKLKIECIQGVDKKDEVIRGWAEKNAVPLKTIVYVGNDLNDLPVIGLTGCVFAPSDANPAFRAAANGVLSKPGGRGAVREVCELILDALAAGKD